MIIWLNGTHGVGKTTTARLVQERIPGSRVLDAEKVGEVLMDIGRRSPSWTTSSTGPRGGRSSSRRPVACSTTRAARS
ncbi:AAA family ATPase [Clavibacter michiganensis]|uniref:AAA family ATPase n=1 Tax=Clavibacter michiganensis TaxID=28447 RepID=UPI001F4E4519|nr:AAA family ATPase [Clavibacter michiganensis]